MKNLVGFFIFIILGFLCFSVGVLVGGKAMYEADSLSRAAVLSLQVEMLMDDDIDKLKMMLCLTYKIEMDRAREFDRHRMLMIISDVYFPEFGEIREEAYKIAFGGRKNCSATTRGTHELQ
jgi:hypothetical protein